MMHSSLLLLLRRGLAASAVATAGTIILGCSPRLTERPVKKTAVAVIVLDESVSSATVQRCQELRARLAGYLSLPGVRRLDATAIGTGDVSTGFEPVSLTSWSRFERAQPKPFAPIAESTTEHDAWLKEQEAICERTLRKTKRSPIRQALERGIESLRAHSIEIAQHGEEASLQLLAVHSDLRDDVDPDIRSRLRGRQGHGALPAINTTGLHLSVTACGISNFRGRGTASSALLPTWHEVLPELGTVDAACPLLPKVRANGGGQ